MFSPEFRYKRCLSLKADVEYALAQKPPAALRAKNTPNLAGCYVR